MTAVFVFLLALIALAPLPFGAVGLWSSNLIATALAILAIVWAFALPSSGRIFAPRRLWPAVSLYVGVLAWICLQASTATPDEWHHPLWQSAGDALDAQVSDAVSINPFESWSQLVRLLAYAATFWLMFQFARDRHRARQATRFIAIAGIGYAAYGVGVQLSGSNTILWLDKTSYFDVLTSTFVNRNSYGTYAGLGLLATTAALFGLIERELPGDVPLRQRFHDAVVLIAGRAWYLVAGWFVLIVALLLTESRGAFVATLLALLSFALTLVLRRSGRGGITKGLVGALLLTVVGFVSLSGDAVLDRLSATADRTDVREEIYSRTLEAIADQPWQGVGAGAFPDAFRLYRSEELTSTVAKAHNTYLENALELGIPAAAALVLSIFWLTAVCAQGVAHRRRDSVYPCMGLATVVLVGTHSLVDFSLQIPAVTLTFAAMLAIGCAQSWSTSDS